MICQSVFSGEIGNELLICQLFILPLYCIAVMLLSESRLSQNMWCQQNLHKISKAKFVRHDC